MFRIWLGVLVRLWTRNQGRRAVKLISRDHSLASCSLKFKSLAELLQMLICIAFLKIKWKLEHHLEEFRSPGRRDTSLIGLQFDEWWCHVTCVRWFIHCARNAGNMISWTPPMKQWFVCKFALFASTKKMPTDFPDKMDRPWARTGLEVQNGKLAVIYSLRAQKNSCVQLN